MPPEEKELLKRSIVLAEENNQILRALHKSMRIGRVIKIIYWTIIIGSAVGAFYIFQPYLEQVINVYGKASGILNGFQ